MDIRCPSVIEIVSIDKEIFREESSRVLKDPNEHWKVQEVSRRFQNLSEYSGGFHGLPT